MADYCGSQAIFGEWQLSNHFQITGFSQFESKSQAEYSTDIVA
jgi:hypothetical protein